MYPELREVLEKNEICCRLPKDRAYEVYLSLISRGKFFEYNGGFMVYI